VKFYRIILLAAALACGQGMVTVKAQGNVHPASSTYQSPTDPLVKAKLEQWQDLKFGMIIHWGLYAVPGMIESWSLCSENWIERDSTSDYGDYKKWYWGLKDQFNPQRFDPDQWAAAARAAGMKYVVFTTKHHDGFNMFDTQQTDFKITDGPFKNHPKANVAKYVFDAFRRQDFMIGAYYSKPDWHSPYFWWPKYATPDRNVNYDIRRYPWRWNQFKQFTAAQIQELMTGYGRIDILWLDGGWVRPLETVTDEVRAWGAPIPPFSQEVDIPAIAAKARQSQPGLLVVDRTVHGAYENYQTPEQRIPASRLSNPWESCITLGDAWGYVPGDQFKSSAKVIHQLIEVVAKGGNMLLGVGPNADGILTAQQVSRLHEIGQWLKHQGAAIYGTRSIDNFQSGNVYFTQGKTGALYALATMQEGKDIPATITWKGNVPRRGTAMTLVSTGEKLKWKVVGEQVTVTLPASARKVYNPAVALTYIAQP